MRRFHFAALAACVLFAQPAGADILSVFDGGHTRQIGPHELEITPGVDGLFYVTASVNGTPVRFVVDSGSNVIVLTHHDAEHAGIDMGKLDFSNAFDEETGDDYEANASVQSLSLESLTLNDVRVTVEKHGDDSLLGMPFLRHLKSVEFRDNKLYLRW